MDANKCDRQIVGNTGMYYACYQLSLKNWNVMPTARNAKGVDIIAYSLDGKIFKGFQVKTLSKRSPIPLGKSNEQIMGDFWIVVVLKETKNSTEPSVYIFTPEEIKRLAHGSGKEGKVTYWIDPKDYCQKKDYRERWDKIPSPASN